MSTAIYPALFFTVALLVACAYFLFGGLPLLILQHDTPKDARFVRGFFDTYYLAAMATAAGTAASWGWLGRHDIALGAAGVVLTAAFLRWKVLGLMDRHRDAIGEHDVTAIPRFRQVQMAATGLCLLQLVVVVWSLIGFSTK